MSTTTEPVRCRHCHRVLRRPSPDGYGPTCRRKLRRAEGVADLSGYKPAQVEAARELLADGAIVPLRSVVFLTISTDGSETYRSAPTTCNCRARAPVLSHGCSPFVARRVIRIGATTMTESCYLCGHTWGVTMTPRDRVLCTPCAQPTPNRWPASYWWHRACTGWPHLTYRSPEWWDQQTSMHDLEYAAEVAAGTWPTTTA